MKVLLMGRYHRTPPKTKIMWCRFCSSLLKADRDDFRETQNGLGQNVWAVTCPVCGGGLVVCER